MDRPTSLRSTLMPGAINVRIPLVESVSLGRDEPKLGSTSHFLLPAISPSSQRDLQTPQQDTARAAIHLLQPSHGEKRIGTTEDTSNPTPNEERQITTHPEDVDADVHKVLGEVVEIMSTTGDVDVVKEETHFSSASAQILIREFMVCNCDLEQFKQNIHGVQKRLSNIIDILGKI
ncbi:uncharacterized protein LOC143927030 [Lithobates pipiens]